MIGSIIGDVIGSYFEWHNTKKTNFKLFSKDSHYTDDTVTTIAIADAILHISILSKNILYKSRSKKIFALKLKEYAKKYPDAGYGSMFKDWAVSDSLKPYKSYGNGSAMRVSPIGFAFDSLEETLKHAKLSAAVTHNHREGIKGAQAISSAVYLARIGESKRKIKTYIENKFNYNLEQKIDELRKIYTFDSSCQGSVPQSIIAFLESDNFEDSIRKAISIGGDSDTIACMTGGISQAYYKKIPEEIVNKTNFKLDIGFKKVIKEFNSKYNIEY